MHPGSRVTLWFQLAYFYSIHPVSLPLLLLPIKYFPSYLSSLGSRLVPQEARASLYVAGILSHVLPGSPWLCWALGSAWKVRWVGPNSVLLGDSKFDSFGLVWFCAHLQWFSVLTGQPGLTHCSLVLVFLRIFGSAFYHYYCVLFWAIAGHVKVLCNCGQQCKTTPSFSIHCCTH
jgi:hypothetical protein